MRAMRCVLAGLLAAAIVTAVAAQPGGGFGGGLGGDVNALVVSNAALHDDLKVTDAQKEKFKPLAERQAELYKGAVGGGKGGFDKEKFAEMREKGQKLSEDIKKTVDEALTADQKKRLHQIAIQQMGMTVFADPEAAGGKGGKGGRGGMSDAQKAIIKEVGEALKLTDAQKSTVKGVMDEFAKERREVFSEAGFGKGGGFDLEKMEATNKKVDKLQKEAMGKVADALDGTQKAAWKGLIGEPFDTAKLRPAFQRKD